MVAFNFMPQFADDVQFGRKTQTIRQKQKCKVGDKIQLYTGQRTKQCRLLGNAVCTAVESVSLGESEIKHQGIRRWLQYNFDGGRGFWQLICGLTDPDGSGIEQFAKDDGFKNSDDMFQFFADKYTLPFIGFLHKWELTND